MTNATGDQRKRLVDGLKKSFAPVKEQTIDRYREVVDLLQAFAEQVTELINQPGSGAPAEVRVELGHLVNQGQEHRVTIKAPEIGLSDYVLRAFVPVDGYPVVLDAFSEADRVCDTPEALVAALVELSGLAAMRQRLSAIRGVLADESLRGQAKHVKPVSRPRGASPRTETKASKTAKSTAKRHSG